MSNVGFRIYKRINRPSKALLEQFKGIPVANIGDEMNRLGCMDARIKPLNSTPLVAPAFTVKARTGDNLMLHRAIDMAEPGDVIVVEDQGDLSHALIGELMMLWAERRGVAGVIVDGAMRDLDVLRGLKISAYAAGIQPGTGRDLGDQASFIAKFGPRCASGHLHALDRARGQLC